MDYGVWLATKELAYPLWFLYTIDLMADIQYSPIVAEVEALVAGLTELRNENTLLKARVLELERKIFNLPEDVSMGRARCCG
jgi:hypothetical protein